MSSKTNIIDIITAKTGMKQMDIAKKLGVSGAQVSKWRKGEDIPDGRRKALNEMAGLFGNNTEWSLLTKTPENAKNWIHFFHAYHEDYIEVDGCARLFDDPEVCVPPMLILFDKIGIKIPEIAPDPYAEEMEEDDDFFSLIKEYLESYAALINWCDINLSVLSDADDIDIFESTLDIGYDIIDFAITYVDKDILKSLGADFSIVAKTVYKSKKSIYNTIKGIVKILVQENKPIMKDYFALINEHPHDLDDEKMVNFVRESGEGSTIKSMLPLFERTVLEHTEFQTALLQELHLKIDLLLKPGDRGRLFKVCKHTPPVRNDLLVQEAADSFKKEKKPSEDGEAGSTEEEKAEPTE